MRLAEVGSVPSVRAAVAAMATLEHPVVVGSARLVHSAAAVTVRPAHRAAADSVPSVHSAAAVMVQPVRAVHRAVAATEPAARVPEPGQ